MGDFSIYKEVKTYKPHRCGYCNEVIPKGSTVEFGSGMFENEWYRYWMCEFCRTWIDTQHPDLLDGFNPDCLSEDLNNEGYNLVKLDYANKTIKFEDQDENIHVLAWEEFFKII